MANKIITPSRRPFVAAITCDSQADHPGFSGSARRAPSHKAPALRDNYFHPTDRLPPTVRTILSSGSCELAVISLSECWHRPRRRSGCPGLHVENGSRADVSGHGSGNAVSRAVTADLAVAPPHAPI